MDSGFVVFVEFVHRGRFARSISGSKNCGTARHSHQASNDTEGILNAMPCQRGHKLRFVSTKYGMYMKHTLNLSPQKQESVSSSTNLTDLFLMCECSVSGLRSSNICSVFTKASSVVMRMGALRSPCTGLATALNL